MPKKIICTVINDLSYDQRMIRICNSLSRAGYQTSLVGRIKEKSIALRAEAFEQRRLPAFFQKGKLKYLEYNIRLFFFLLSQPCDIICAVDLDTITPALLASRLRNKILVYDAHEYFTELPEVARRPLVKLIWEWVAKACIPRVDIAYTVSQSLAEELADRYDVPFSLVRNLPTPAPLPDQAPEIAPNEPFILLYQGVLNEGRGLEVAVRAMQKLKNAELWLAGEGDRSAALRKMATDLGVTDKVRFLGYVPPHELPALTRQAHLGLNLLARRSLNYYYSLANKTFDYIQSGLPAIQMDFPEYRRLQQAYGCFLLLEDLRENDLLDLIGQIRRDPEGYRQLQAACRRAAEELHWEAEERKLLAIYEGLGNKVNEGVN